MWPWPPITTPTIINDGNGKDLWKQMNAHTQLAPFSSMAFWYFLCVESWPLAVPRPCLSQRQRKQMPRRAVCLGLGCGSLLIRLRHTHINLLQQFELLLLLLWVGWHAAIRDYFPLVIAFVLFYWLSGSWRRIWARRWGLGPRAPSSGRGRKLVPPPAFQQEPWQRLSSRLASINNQE